MQKNFHLIFAAITALFSIGTTERHVDILAKNPGNAATISATYMPDWDNIRDRTNKYTSRPGHYWAHPDHQPPIPSGATRGDDDPYEGKYTWPLLMRFPFKEPGIYRKYSNNLLPVPWKWCPITVFENVGDRHRPFRAQQEVDNSWVGKYKKIWTGSVASNSKNTWLGSRFWTGVTVRFGPDCTPRYNRHDRGRLKIMTGFHTDKEIIYAKWTRSEESFCHDKETCKCKHVGEERGVKVYTECITYDEYYQSSLAS